MADSRETDVSVIIVNWNTAPDTIRCARELASWTTLHPTVWIVDNASTNGSANVIARDCPEVHLIRSPVNLGYSAGNNRGLAAALEHNQAPIMLLNNDTTISETDVLRLLDTLRENSHIGIVGPLLFEADEPDTLITAGGRDMVRHISSHIQQVSTDPPVRIVDYMPGTVFLGKAEIFATVGLLDERYFYGGELPDLCYRAKQHGYLSAVDTRARALHALNRSSKFRQTLYPYYIIRNRFLFIRKFYGYSRYLFYSFWALYSLALSLKVQFAGQRQTARAIRLGFLDGLRGRYGGQNERVFSESAR